jgi:hypothetical protein
MSQCSRPLLRGMACVRQSACVPAVSASWTNEYRAKLAEDTHVPASAHVGSWHTSSVNSTTAFGKFRGATRRARGVCLPLTGHQDWGFSLFCMRLIPIARLGIDSHVASDIYSRLYWRANHRQTREVAHRQSGGGRPNTYDPALSAGVGPASVTSLPRSTSRHGKAQAHRR